MKIKVNGQDKNLDLDCEKISLSKILESLGYKPNTIVVELNNLIVNKKLWEKAQIKDGDKLEIVSIVGGG